MGTRGGRREIERGERERATFQTNKETYRQLLVHATGAPGSEIPCDACFDLADVLALTYKPVSETRVEHSGHVVTAGICCMAIFAHLLWEA